LLGFGAMDRMRYLQNDWPPTPPSIKYRGGDVILDASPESPNVIMVLGNQFEKMARLGDTLIHRCQRRAHFQAPDISSNRLRRPRWRTTEAVVRFGDDRVQAGVDRCP
jgi:hypothetical protein